MTESKTAGSGISREDVETIIKQVMDDVIGPSPYSHSESATWNQTAVENITKKLVALNKPFKYIVTSSLLQLSNGSGLNVSTISYWNKQTDYTYQLRWETKQVLAVVYVFAIAI